MIQRPTRQQAEKEFSLVPEGTHTCTLKLSDCTVKDWVQVGGSWTRSGEERDGVKFSFNVEGTDDQYIIRKETNSSHENGGLIKMMRMCRDSFLGDIEFNEKGWPVDEELFYSVLEGLDQYLYQVTVKHTESNGNTYANFVKCKPIGKKGSSKPVSEPTQGELEDTSFNDDVPF